MPDGIWTQSGEGPPGDDDLQALSSNLETGSGWASSHFHLQGEHRHILPTFSQGVEGGSDS